MDEQIHAAAIAPPVHVEPATFLKKELRCYRWPLPANKMKYFYGMKRGMVVGSCLAPLLNDGDYFWVDKTLQPASGDLVTVWMRERSASDPKGIEGVVKRLLSVQTPTGLKWILAANSFHFPMQDNFEIQGVVVASMRRPGKRSGRGEEADAATAQYHAELRSA